MEAGSLKSGLQKGTGSACLSLDSCAVSLPAWWPPTLVPSGEAARPSSAVLLAGLPALGLLALKATRPWRLRQRRWTREPLRCFPVPAGSLDGASAAPAPLPSTGDISWGTQQRLVGYALFSGRTSAKNRPRTSCFLLFNVYRPCWLVVSVECFRIYVWKQLPAFKVFCPSAPPVPPSKELTWLITIRGGGGPKCTGQTADRTS